MAKQGSGKRFIIVGGAVVVFAAVIAYFGLLYPPSDSDVAGTIGAAKRHVTEQITSDDVVLQGMDLQQFMQTDTFDRLIHNEEAMSLLSVLRLGVNLGMLDRVALDAVNELCVAVQPGHLQKRAGETLDPKSRDAIRADLIREHLGAS